MDISKPGFLITGSSLAGSVRHSSAIKKCQLENHFKQKAEAAENNGITAGHTNSYYLVFVISGGGLLSSFEVLQYGPKIKILHECTCNACKLCILWGHN